MLKHPLANVVVKGNPKNRRMLIEVLGSLGKAGINVYGVGVEEDELKFYVKESECDRAVGILDRVVRGNIQFYIMKGIGMITVSGGGRGRFSDIDTLIAPVKREVRVVDIIRSDNSAQLFVELRDRGRAFQKLVKRVTNGFRVTKA